MNIFEQKRQIRRLMYSKIAMVGLFVVCGFLANGLFNIYGKARESMDRKNLSAQSLVRLQEREAKLQAEIIRFQKKAKGSLLLLKMKTVRVLQPPQKTLHYRNAPRLG
jgi:uncharacterized protein YlxW (UPF0749 family)